MSPRPLLPRTPRASAGRSFSSVLPFLSLLLFAPAAAAQIGDEYAPGPLPAPMAPPPTTAEPPPLPEPPSARFGAQGQVVVQGDADLSVSSTTYTAPSQASYFHVNVEPSVDYFVLRNFSIGLAFGAGYTDAKGYGADGSLVETQATSVSGGPRFGWNIPLGSSFSWWLQGTLGVEANSTNQSLVSGTSVSTSSSAGAPSTSQDGPFVSAYAPLLFHPAPHFFLGAGPSFFHEFARLQGGPNVGDERTTVGVAFIVGGYVGGTPDPSSAPTDASPAVATRVPRFGERSQLLLSNDLTASVFSTQYQGTSSSALQGQLVLGGDYFFVDHVSLGMGVNASHYESTGTDANGNTVTNNNTSFGLSVRLGAEIPLAPALSLYPRASLGFNGGNISEQSAGGADAYSVTETWVSLYVPLVVRVAPHFIVGFGPSVTHDIDETDTFTATQQQVSNPATRVGAGFLVGGWL